MFKVAFPKCSPMISIMLYTALMSHGRGIITAAVDAAINQVTPVLSSSKPARRPCKI